MWTIIAARSLAVIERGRPGEIYNIGGSRALPNIEVVRMLLATLGKPESLMQTVTDRPGHDRRYALSSEKLMRETGWEAADAVRGRLAARPSIGTATIQIGSRA